MNLRPSKANMANGFTLIEILIAICVLSIGLLAVGSMQVSAIRGNSYARHVTDASTMAQDRLEKLLSLSYTDADLTADSHVDPDPPDSYAITWDITDGGTTNPNVVANTKLIEVKVEGGGLRKEIVFSCLKRRF